MVMSDGGGDSGVEVGAVSFSIAVDLAGFERQLDQAEQVARSRADRIAQSLSRIPLGQAGGQTASGNRVVAAAPTEQSAPNRPSAAPSGDSDAAVAIRTLNATIESLQRDQSLLASALRELTTTLQQSRQGSSSPAGNDGFRNQQVETELGQTASVPRRMSPTATTQRQIPSFVSRGPSPSSTIQVVQPLSSREEEASEKIQRGVAERITQSTKRRQAMPMVIQARAGGGPVDEAGGPFFPDATALIQSTSSTFFSALLHGKSRQNKQLEDLTSPYRANGGPVGKLPYLVGERGPELFVPKTAGYVWPHDSKQTKDWVARVEGGEVEEGGVSLNLQRRQAGYYTSRRGDVVVQRDVNAPAGQQWSVTIGGVHYGDRFAQLGDARTFAEGQLQSTRKEPDNTVASRPAPPKFIGFKYTTKPSGEVIGLPEYERQEQAPRSTPSPAPVQTPPPTRRIPPREATALPTTSRPKEAQQTQDIPGAFKPEPGTQQITELTPEETAAVFAGTAFSPEKTAAPAVTTEAIVEAVKKKRTGRRRHPQAAPPELTPELIDKVIDEVTATEPELPSTPKRRGRPPKVATTQEAEQTTTTAESTARDADIEQLLPSIPAAPKVPKVRPPNKKEREEQEQEQYAAQLAQDMAAAERRESERRARVAAREPLTSQSLPQSAPRQTPTASSPTSAPNAERIRGRLDQAQRAHIKSLAAQLRIPEEVAEAYFRNEISAADTLQANPNADAARRAELFSRIQKLSAEREPLSSDDSDRRRKNLAAQREAEQKARLAGSAFSNISSRKLVFSPLPTAQQTEENVARVEGRPFSLIRGHRLVGSAPPGGFPPEEPPVDSDDDNRPGRPNRRGARIFGLNPQTALRATAAFFGVGLGISVAAGVAAKLHDSIVGTVDAAIQLEQTARGVGVAFGQVAAQQLTGRGATAFAADPLARGSRAEFQTAVASQAPLAAQYQLTTDQVQQLTLAEGQLAQIHGVELPQATQVFTAVLQGNIQAGQALGLQLTDENGRIKSVGLSFEELTASVGRVRAEQILLGAIQQDVDRQLKNNAESSTDLTRSLDVLDKSLTNVKNSFASAAAGPTTGAAKELSSLANQVSGFLGGPTTPTGPGVPRHASGTKNSAGGWAIVGERGPEIVVLPAGSQVVPNKDISHFAEGTGDLTPAQQFELKYGAIPRDTGRADEFLQRHAGLLPPLTEEQLLGLQSGAPGIGPHRSDAQPISYPDDRPARLVANATPVVETAQPQAAQTSDGGFDLGGAIQSIAGFVGKTTALANPVAATGIAAGATLAGVAGGIGGSPYAAKPGRVGEVLSDNPFARVLSGAAIGAGAGAGVGSVFPGPGTLVGGLAGGLAGGAAGLLAPQFLPQIPIIAGKVEGSLAGAVSAGLSTLADAIPIAPLSDAVRGLADAAKDISKNPPGQPLQVDRGEIGEAAPPVLPSKVETPGDVRDKITAEATRRQQRAGLQAAEAQARLDTLDAQAQQRLVGVQGERNSKQQQLNELTLEHIGIQDKLAPLQLRQQAIAEQITIKTRENLDLTENLLLARQAQVPTGLAVAGFSYQGQKQQLQAGIAIRQAIAGQQPDYDLGTVVGEMIGLQLGPEQQKAQLADLEANYRVTQATAAQSSDQLGKSISVLPEQRQLQSLERQIVPLQQAERTAQARGDAIERALQGATLKEGPQRISAEQDLVNARLAQADAAKKIADAALDFGRQSGVPDIKVEVNLGGLTVPPDVSDLLSQIGSTTVTATLEAIARANVTSPTRISGNVAAAG